MTNNNSVDYHIKDFGDLVPGDKIIGSKGLPVTVLRAYEEHIPKRMYRLEFDNGETIETSGNHLWYVETQLDRQLHKQRLKNGIKLLGKLSNDSRSDLLQMATFKTPLETEVFDMVQMVEVEGADTQEIAKFLIRIAESIGHIMEENKQYQDIHEGGIHYEEKTRLYDARLFSQQILSFADKRYRNQWEPIVGRVITTDQIMELSSTLAIDFPEIRPFKNSNTWNPLKKNKINKNILSNKKELDKIEKPFISDDSPNINVDENNDDRLDNDPPEIIHSEKDILSHLNAMWDEEEGGKMPPFQVNNN